VQEARNIVWYRENVGPFRGVEELSKVPGIDAARAQVIRGLIRVR
jgi:DNA uptake protein ComE-like DNA-binding protein